MQRPSLRRAGPLALAVAVVWTASARPAGSATFIVNALYDAQDVAPGDGICDDGTGNCTLRAAIMEANNFFVSDPDVIAIKAGLYQLVIPGPGEDNAQRADLDIFTPMIVRGLSLDQNDVVIDAGTLAPGLDRIFHVHSMPAGVDVKIENLTITGGFEAAGGGLLHQGGSALSLYNVGVINNRAQFVGGGIYTDSTLLVQDSTIAKNVVIDPGCANGGGGIYLDGAALRMRASTVNGNEASGSCGGGLYNNSGSLQVFQSTVSDNKAQFEGGGIFGLGAGFALSHATVYRNQVAAGVAGGLFSSAASFLQGTIVGDNNPQNCDPPLNFNSLAGNLDSDGSCNLVPGNDLPGVAPMLSPLAANGGPTPTHLPVPGSPVLDFIAAPCFDFAGDLVNIDQRHFVRPADGDGDGIRQCDIGSVEARTGPLLINEVDADTPGALDNLEFIEIYDGGFGNTRLDGFVLAFYDGATLASYSLPPHVAAIDLSGFATDAAGYFVVGNPGVPAAAIHFADGALDDGADAVALLDTDPLSVPPGTPATTPFDGPVIVDAVVYATADPFEPGLLDPLTPGQPQVDEASGLGGPELDSSQRCPNASGIPRGTLTHLALPPTPGGFNHCGTPDYDGDGVTYFNDCNDFDPLYWDTPGEAINLRWNDAVVFEWDPPLAPGGVALVHDVLRADAPDDFILGTICHESDDGSDTKAAEPGAPAVGLFWSYLSRAQNGCPIPEGPLGFSSGGTPIAGISCP